MNISRNPSRPILLAASIALASGILFPSIASATNGYLSHGYGIKSQGIAGIGIALPQDSLAAATNPAGTAFVGNRIDTGISLFEPKRDARIAGNLFGPDASYDGNGKKSFLIPEIGYSRQISSGLSAGIAVYGNGGMNTEYGRNPYARFGATGKAGVDLSQLFISPNLAYKLNDDNAIGIAINFAYQRFKAEGLGPFTAASLHPAEVTNRNYDSSTGWGTRIGWIGKLTPDFTLGLAWSSKIDGKFKKYRGLFAEDGGFDIPENYGAGIAYKFTPALTLAADVQEIKYGSVKSIASPLSRLLTGNPLGSSNGPGFGWRDITTWKVGVSYDYSPGVVLRAGYSTTDQPIPSNQTFFNILAPGVIQDHLTLGGTWTLEGGNELSLSLAHGFRKSINGSNSIPPGFPPGFGGGNANVSLEENILGIAYAWKLP